MHPVTDRFEKPRSCIIMQLRGIQVCSGMVPLLRLGRELHQVARLSKTNRASRWYFTM